MSELDVYISVTFFSVIPLGLEPRTPSPIKHGESDAPINKLL